METTDKKLKEEEPTLTELVESIVTALKTKNGQVSVDRAQSVESHLRVAIRELGYGPTETPEKKATIMELAEQLALCLEAEDGHAAEERHDNIHAHLKTTLSNMKAEINAKATPPLKKVPVAKPQA